MSGLRTRKERRMFRSKLPSSVVRLTHLHMNIGDAAVMYAVSVL